MKYSDCKLYYELGSNKFSAQGFVKDGLSRVCVIPCKVKKPRAVLLVRLLFFSKFGAGRLHEEIIPISAEWKSVRDRSQGLSVFKETGEESSLKYIQEALLKDDFEKIAESVVKKYIQEDFVALADGILQKLAHRWVDVENALKNRAEIEAESLKKLLENQLFRIKKALSEPEEKQLALNLNEFSQKEKNQVEADRRALIDKIERLNVEILEEPAKVRKLYEFHTPRVEKLGMVYLWPEAGV